MFDVSDQLPLDWPVDVNFHEAKAFCAWKGGNTRLLSEAEHNACRGLAEFVEVADDPIYDEKSADSYNFNLTFGSSTVRNFEFEVQLKTANGNDSQTRILKVIDASALRHSQANSSYGGYTCEEVP